MTTAGVEIVSIRHSEDCQKFSRTAEDGVSSSPTDTRQIREYFNLFYSHCRSSTTATTPIDQVENDPREPTGLLTSYYKFILSK